jgi:hypothetical protein
MLPARGNKSLDLTKLSGIAPLGALLLNAF